jgi:hypothetical protein
MDTLGTRWRRKVTALREDRREPAYFTEINVDGVIKYAFVFAEIPALIFVSHDGLSTYDQTFEDGVESVTHRRVAIESAIGELTTYTLEKYAVATAM